MEEKIFILISIIIRNQFAQTMDKVENIYLKKDFKQKNIYFEIIHEYLQT